MRSQSFAQQQRPFQFRDNSQPGYQDEQDLRPRSSDAKSESHLLTADGQLRDLHITEPGEIVTPRETQSARASVDRDTRSSVFAEDISMGGAEQADVDRGLEVKSKEPDATGVDAGQVSCRCYHGRLVDSRRQEQQNCPHGSDKIDGPLRDLKFSVKPAAVPEASESDDDEEDMADYFANEIGKAEQEFSKLDGTADVPIVIAYGMPNCITRALRDIVRSKEGLVDMLGPFPDGVERPWKIAKEEPSAPSQPQVETTAATSLREPSVVSGKQAADTTEEMVSSTDPIKPKVDENGCGLCTTTKQESPEPGADAKLVEEKVSEKVSGPQDASADAVDKPATTTTTTTMVLTAPDQIAASGQSPVVYASTEPIETIEGHKALPSTPSQMEEDEEDEESESDYPDEAAIESVRWMPTPPIDAIPEYRCRKWTRDKDFIAGLESDPLIDEFILEHLEKISLDRMESQEDCRKTYAGQYAGYLNFTLSVDPVAVKSRDKFSVTAPPPDPVAVVPVVPESKPEGRGAGRRFASERDLERVLQASMREDEERRERELRLEKEKYRSERRL